MKKFNIPKGKIKLKNFNIPKLKMKLKKWQIIVIAILLIAIIGGIASALIRKNRAKSAMGQMSTEAVVARQTIVSSITGSSVVMPKDQYSITSLVSGDVLVANFEQGDIVNEGDVLYQIDSSDVESSIKSANLNVQRSTNSYNQAISNQNDLTVKAGVSGIIKKLYIKKGDTVNTGAQIAEIYDDSVLELTIPFNEADVSALSVGAAASVSISGTGETLAGTVTQIKGGSYAKSGNMLVRDVVIKVKNPGTLMNTDTAVATVGSVACNDAGTLAYITEKTITAKAGGDVSKLFVSEGDRVTASTTIAQLSSESIAQSITNNSLSLQESMLSRDNAQKKLEDYTITAPISGTVIEKNIKAGDKLDATSASTAMAVIYDMSALEFELSVDELDIKNVEVGQAVTITSDALEGKVYHGEVTNVSVNGTTENGVTTYPVTVNITDFDEELLPGMNIDAEIITSQAENALAVPVSAVSRGNIVYVKGEKTDEEDRAPEGFYSVTVETGVYNDSFIEIRSGLSEGDVIWVPQTTSSETGMSGMFGMGGMPMGGMGGMGGMPMGGGMPSGGMPSGGSRSGGMSSGGNRSGGGMR